MNQTSRTAGTEMGSVTTTNHHQVSPSSTSNSLDTTRTSQDGKACISVAQVSQSYQYLRVDNYDKFENWTWSHIVCILHCC